MTLRGVTHDAAFFISQSWFTFHGPAGIRLYPLLGGTGAQLQAQSNCAFQCPLGGAGNEAISFAQGQLETIYDFYGFPDELYQLTYPAPGSPKLAEELEKRFNEQHIRTNRHNTRGLDHGSWVFLRYMYPEADIPIVTVSVNPFLPVQEQLAIGESLRGLGEDNI